MYPIEVLTPRVDEEPAPDQSPPEGWETINMDILLLSARQASKRNTKRLRRWSSTSMGGKFALTQNLDVALPQLCFHFCDGVREACAM